MTSKNDHSSARKQEMSSTTLNEAENKSAGFRVAGIGASAGGVEAIKLFLQHLSGQTGIAFVIVQHLSADYESNLSHLLSKETQMKVNLVNDGMKIRPNEIYVIPPDTYMSLSDDMLRLIPRKNKSGLFLPVDFFFKSLATAYKNKSIGILLSGTGADGTQGFKAIKAEGGITFAQDEAAAFSGMSRSAIDSGFVDFILPVEKIADELKQLIRHPYTSLPAQELETADEKELKKILYILLNKKGIDFSLYKLNTVNRRILRRMALNHKKNLEAYIGTLQNENREIEQLYDDLLINVTSFSRDTALFQALRKKVLPQLLKDRKAGDTLRVWVPGCATGEEAYSFAIAIFEYFSEKGLSFPFQIFATDLNGHAIDKARTGIYPPGSLENVRAAYMRKYFIPVEGNFQVMKFIRDVCVFSRHNMVSDPPFSRMDMVSCQNVLIYFEPVLQEKILKIFHYSLKPDGYLFLGKSEAISSNADLFQQADKELKVYRKKNGSGHYNFDFSYTITRTGKSLPTETNILNKDKATDADVERMSDNILLSRYVPPSVVVNSDLLIIRFHGATSRFLQPSRGKASLNLLKMLHEDLVLELRSLIYKARKEKAPVQVNNVLLHFDKHAESVNLEVIPLQVSTAEPYFLILFKEAAAKKGAANQLQAGSKDAESSRIVSLEDEVRDLKEQIASMSDEFEATREELQSAHEEVLSSNEELQSINEELETSKEELQSINEELQLRNAELSEAFEYRQAIVETIREPLIVLTPDLRISSANRAFYTHFHQERAETEGVFIFEMKNGKWNIPRLKGQLLEVISKNKTLENFEVHHKFPVIGERHIIFTALRMRYNHNQQNRILLVIEDITERREAENKLIESVKLNTSILNSISDIFIAVNNKWEISYINPKGESFAGKKSKEIIGKNLWDVLTFYIATDFQKKLVSAMKSKCFSRFEYYDEKEEEWYDFRLYPSEETLSIYGSRVSEQKRAQQLLEESTKRYELFITQSSEGIWRLELREPVSTELTADEQIENWFQNAFVAECNDAMAKMYGYHKAKELEGVPLKEVLQQNEKNLGTLKAFIESGYRINEAETLYKKDDRVIYFLNNMVGIIKDKKLISIWGTKQDVTSKKNIEQTLIKTRQQLNFALAAGSVGTYVWDFKTNKIKWTKVQESLYGLKEYSFKGTLDDWMSFIHPDDVTCTRKAIEEAIHSQRELAVEFRIRWPDNSLHWILSRASTTYDTDGKPVEMMGVNIDISDRKMQEQLVQENEERFKALVQNSFDVITVFNLDGTITYQSDSIERVLGYTASERIGKNLFEDSVVHPEDREKERKLFQECIEKPFQYIQGEFRMRHKNGSYCIMEVGCINLLQNSSIHGIIKNYRDVTERRAIEKQKEEFIGIASHELKTPVTSIKAYTQILHDTLVEKKDEASASLLLRMDHQIDRLTALIKDLLDVTKITEGQLVLKHEVFDMNDLVTEVAEDLQMTTQKHRIIRELGELKPLTGDKERIAQVLVNLLSNAIKYSPSADKVIIKTSGTESGVIVSIQDFGIGISKEMQKKLFTRFFRVTDETSSTFPGLGLGLFISTEIIRKQKGRIWVESAPNEGSTFSFSLPYTKD